MLDPTQIKRANPVDERLPAVRSPHQPESYQRAPTLAGGATLGKHGTVQVWGPDRRLLRVHAMASTGTSVALVGGILWALISGPDLDPGRLALVTVAMGLWILATAVCAVHRAAIRKPRYLTTDDAGIGITTLGGQRTLTREDIVGASFRPLISETDYA